MCLVRLVGVAPTIPKGVGFSYHYSFHYQIICLWSGLYLHHSFRLRCPPSSLYTFKMKLSSSFARYYHFTGFTEFDGFYSDRFRKGTQFSVISSKSNVYSVPPQTDNSFQFLYSISDLTACQALENFGDHSLSLL